jgi:hypothetical protein
MPIAIKNLDMDLIYVNLLPKIDQAFSGHDYRGD